MTAAFRSDFSLPSSGAHCRRGGSEDSDHGLPCACRRRALRPASEATPATTRWRGGEVHHHLRRLSFLAQNWLKARAHVTRKAAGRTSERGVARELVSRPSAGRGALLFFFFPSLPRHHDDQQHHVCSEQERAIAPSPPPRSPPDVGAAWRCLLACVVVVVSRRGRPLLQCAEQRGCCGAVFFGEHLPNGSVRLCPARITRNAPRSFHRRHCFVAPLRGKATCVGLGRSMVVG